MVDDEVPFVGFMAKAGWPATRLRTWIRFAAVHAAMTIADLVDRSTLISAETSARAGIEDGVWYGGTPPAWTLPIHRCTARDDPHRRVRFRASCSNLRAAASSVCSATSPAALPTSSAAAFAPRFPDAPAASAA